MPTLIQEITQQYQHLPPQPSAIAIFLNGERDIIDVDFFISRNYDSIIVCDGAWNSFQKLTEEMQKLQDCTKIIVLGDGDSIVDKPDDFLKLDCQNTTDFEKAIDYVLGNLTVESKRHELKINIDVFWANGGALDHNLGNLAIAYKYANTINNVQCHFYTDTQYYRYMKGGVQFTVSDDMVDSTISIIPFPSCEVMTTKGLKYEMHNYKMHLHTQQSLRNQIIQSHVAIDAAGDYFLFISY